jgi:hypothetical protein
MLSVNPSFRYQLGDLVEFKAPRVTEEFIDDITVRGIVIKQRYVFTAANRFRVQTPSGNYWVGADHLTLLSSGTK